jgi:hypothetical protein
MFCHQYPTRACVTGNGEVRSLFDNVSSSPKDDNETVKNHCDCKHQCGQELGLSSTVSICELLINVVIDNKPKMLTGLSQKASSQAQRLNRPLTQMLNYRRKRQHLTYSGAHTERGKPVSVPMRESEPRGKPIQMQVWDDGKSECHLVMRWIGVEPQATSLHAKVGLLPSGLSSQENLSNRLRRECR